MLWNRLPNLDHIANIIHSLVLLCPICKCVEESTVHILFSCRCASLLSSMIRDQFQLDFSDFDNWRFGVWLEEQKGKARDETILLQTVIANTLWHLWINKNDCHYHNHQTNVHVLFWKIVSATIDFLNNI